MDRCSECSAPMEDQEKCACNPALCLHCCKCDESCGCKCKEKIKKMDSPKEV